MKKMNLNSKERRVSYNYINDYNTHNNGTYISPNKENKNQYSNKFAFESPNTEENLEISLRDNLRNKSSFGKSYYYTDPNSNMKTKVKTNVMDPQREIAMNPVSREAMEAYMKVNAKINKNFKSPNIVNYMDKSPKREIQQIIRIPKPLYVSPGKNGSVYEYGFQGSPNNIANQPQKFNNNNKTPSHHNSPHNSPQKNFNDLLQENYFSLPVNQNIIKTENENTHRFESPKKRIIVTEYARSDENGKINSPRKQTRKGNYINPAKIEKIKFEDNSFSPKFTKKGGEEEDIEFKAYIKKPRIEPEMKTKEQSMKNETPKTPKEESNWNNYYYYPNPKETISDFEEKKFKSPISKEKMIMARIVTDYSPKNKTVYNKIDVYENNFYHCPIRQPKPSSNSKNLNFSPQKKSLENNFKMKNDVPFNKNRPKRSKNMNNGDMGELQIRKNYSQKNSRIDVLKNKLPPHPNFQYLGNRDYEEDTPKFKKNDDIEQHSDAFENFDSRNYFNNRNIEDFGFFN